MVRVGLGLANQRQSRGQDSTQSWCPSNENCRNWFFDMFSVEHDVFEERSVWDHNEFSGLFAVKGLVEVETFAAVWSGSKFVKPSEDDINTSLPVALSGPLPGCLAFCYGSHCSSGQKQKSWIPTVSNFHLNKTILNVELTWSNLQFNQCFGPIAASACNSADIHNFWRWAASWVEASRWMKTLKKCVYSATLLIGKY